MQKYEQQARELRGANIIINVSDFRHTENTRSKPNVAHCEQQEVKPKTSNRVFERPQI